MKILKHVLFETYGGFSDKRIKNLDRDNRLTIDDRSEHDFDAGDRLFLWFCEMYAEVLSTPTQLTLDGHLLTAETLIETLRVRLDGGVPKSRGVQAWIRANGATFRDGDIRSTLEFDVIKGKQEILRDLAAAIRAIVAPGAPHYEVSSYKHVCPRTADSLDRLANTLDPAWSG